MSVKVEDVVVVIPVYKDSLSKDEELSLIQCLHILSRYQICIITNKDVDLGAYHSIIEKSNLFLKTEMFDKKYFANIEGYNSLMLSPHFYYRFKKYKYMLIYQLDAFVFSDELLEWCNKGYDYIGAPWFEEYGCFDKGKKLWAVGNGGFSLRRIDKMNNFLTQRNVYNMRYLRKQYHGSLKSIFICILHYFGWKNSMNRFLVEHNDENEDAVFGIFSKDTQCRMNIPSPEVALCFSFEKSPSYLFNMNSEHLPFGCHAWRKYEYESFWSQYIR